MGRRFSEMLFSETEDLWKEAVNKPFVKKMADGTLETEKYRRYMLQDYLYLTDYIELLREISESTEKKSLRSFLEKILRETQEETERVHLPAMRELGITDTDIQNAVMAQVLQEYVGYMKQQLREEGFVGGLVALLQCSWAYAYIGQTVSEREAERLSASPYKSWFASYTCASYIETNQSWIDASDRETEDLDDTKKLRLCSVFQTCARYENRFWDDLDNA
ncbi:MAG: hypothetical protein K6B69_08780 [Lachnospiraceae bacterium]|nr:hypothetical protein [Lachnospiraceae bacterium]